MSARHSSCVASLPYDTEQAGSPHACTYLGLFLVAFAILTYEVLLTRIFSVTMWHHFAVMSISLAMFGLSVGALLVHTWPGLFPASKTNERLAQSALAFAIAIVVSFLTHLSIPFAPRPNAVFFFSAALTYVVLAIPFIFGGICICLALTRFPARVSRLYAIDLVGSALGCFAILALLDVIDGPSSVLVVAAMAALAAMAFAIVPASPSRLFRSSAVLALLCLILGVGNSILAAGQQPWLYIPWAKGAREARPLYEKWNSLGRVQVVGDMLASEEPHRYGLGSRYSDEARVRELVLTIDATSFTVLTGFDGSFDGLRHLGQLVMNIAHHLRSDADVLVLGTGGGRELLTSLAFNQRSVVGVEINKGVLEAVHGKFGDFTGHLERHPKVHLVNDDGRNFLRGPARSFDIVQMVSVGGVFVLLEQPLYTVEAWTAILSRLKPRGIFSMSRTYAPNGAAEFYRAAALAAASLRELGVSDPRAHIAIVRSYPTALARSDTTGTLLVSRQPFEKSELATLASISERAGFEIIFDPEIALDAMFPALVSGANPSGASAPALDLSPPTDDRPFFFNVLRFRDLLSTDNWRNRTLLYNLEALAVLVALLVVVTLLIFAFFMFPLRAARRERGKGAIDPLGATYFAAIGIGFIFVEIAQLQRLTMYLGHPTYGLSVVLSTLLVSSGAGSWLTEKMPTEKIVRLGRLQLFLLSGLLVVISLLGTQLLEAFGEVGAQARIGLAVVTVALPGLLMGMALPLGMRLANVHSGSNTPWLWCINGATSVLGSVAAMALALSVGITAVLSIAAGVYAVAAVTLWLVERRTSCGNRTSDCVVVPAVDRSGHAS